MGKFIINKNSNNEFQFDFVDTKGKIILSSGEYTRKLMCLKGIESVRRNSQDNIKFCRKASSNKEYYFKLKAFNGKVIGVSRVFKSKILRDKGIDFLKNKTARASVEDRSKQSIKMIFISNLDIAI